MVLVCVGCGHTMEVAPRDGFCPVPSCGHVPVELDVLHASGDDLLLGRVVGGRYQIHGVLGDGAHGRVYRAREHPLGRTVALKMIRGGREADRRRYLAEAKVVGRLTCDRTVRLFDHFEDAGDLFMALECLDGRTLRAAIQAEAPFEPARAVALASDILESLAEAHRMGVVHRDLKPENVMLVLTPLREERARVLDFGVARLVAGPVFGPGSVIEDRAKLVGTARYMAPEQFRSGEVDGRADLYALGTVLYEMLTGRTPFDVPEPADADGPADDPRVTLLAWMQMHTSGIVPPLSPALAAFAPALERCLAKRPSDRPADAAAVAEDLRAALGTWARPAPQAPGRPRRPALWAAAASAAALALVGLWWAWPSAPPVAAADVPGPAPPLPTPPPAGDPGGHVLVAAPSLAAPRSSVAADPPRRADRSREAPVVPGPSARLGSDLPASTTSSRASLAAPGSSGPGPAPSGPRRRTLPVLWGDSPPKPGP